MEYVCEANMSELFEYRVQNRQLGLARARALLPQTKAADPVPTLLTANLLIRP